MKPLPDEASQLAILASDADKRSKGVACQYLTYVAGPKSVPAVTPLLADPELAAYARSVLESIDDPAAASALRDVLPKLKGRLLAGVVNSLGVKRDAASVPALQKLALDPAAGVQPEAIASLGQIASPEAAATLTKILGEGPAKLKTPAAHAALTAASCLQAGGDQTAASALRAKVATAFPTGHIHQAASS